MVVLSVVTAYIFFLVFPLREESSELLSRTNPDIRDVLIAFFGGLALIIAKTKKENISSAIFGVAIATALMPPLCTAGFYFAEQDYDQAINALYLFTINSMYIIVASYLVLKILRFPLINYANSTRRSFINRLVSIVSLIILVPSIITFNGVLNKSQFDSQASEFLENELIGIPNYEFLKNTALYNYNDGNSSIIINTYGQKPLSLETINFLSKKIQNYGELKNTKLEFIQNDNSLSNSNKFINELRKRDSLELVSKNNEINKLNQKLNDLESLSREKLIFNSLAKEIKIIYPDLNEFEVFETIKTDFNQIDTVLVFNLRWNKELENEEKLKLNENVKNWLKFQLENDVFEIRSNTN
tara:strand:- start:501 stop:1571 length:1071 start_codon:yes stop_codon:yes gene_type:complete